VTAVGHLTTAPHLETGILRLRDVCEMSGTDGGMIENKFEKKMIGRFHSHSLFPKERNGVVIETNDAVCAWFLHRVNVFIAGILRMGPLE